MDNAKVFECAKRSWNKFRWYSSGKLIHRTQRVAKLLHEYRHEALSEIGTGSPFLNENEILNRRKRRSYAKVSWRIWLARGQAWEYVEYVQYNYTCIAKILCRIIERVRSLANVRREWWIIYAERGPTYGKIAHASVMYLLRGTIVVLSMVGLTVLRAFLSACCPYKGNNGTIAIALDCNRIKR